MGDSLTLGSLDRVWSLLPPSDARFRTVSSRLHLKSSSLPSSSPLTRTDELVMPHPQVKGQGDTIETASWLNEKEARRETPRGEAAAVKPASC